MGVIKLRRVMSLMLTVTLITAITSAVIPLTAKAAQEHPVLNESELKDKIGFGSDAGDTIKVGANITITGSSTLYLRNQKTLIVQSGHTLTIENGNNLIVYEDAQIIVEEDALLVIYSTLYIAYSGYTGIATLENNGKIRVYGSLFTDTGGTINNRGEVTILGGITNYNLGTFNNATGGVLHFGEAASNDNGNEATAFMGIYPTNGMTGNLPPYIMASSFYYIATIPYYRVLAVQSYGKTYSWVEPPYDYNNLTERDLSFSAGVISGTPKGAMSDPTLVTVYNEYGSHTSGIIFMTGNPVPVIGISATFKNMQVGDTYRIPATVSPVDASYTHIEWEAQPSGIVSIQNGVITALSPGTVTIIGTIAHGYGVQNFDFVSEQYSVTVTAASSNPGNDPNPEDNSNNNENNNDSDSDSDNDNSNDERRNINEDITTPKTGVTINLVLMSSALVISFSGMIVTSMILVKKQRRKNEKS